MRIIARLVVRRCIACVAAQAIAFSLALRSACGTFLVFSSQ
jgi:hypothetical protein